VAEVSGLHTNYWKRPRAVKMCRHPTVHGRFKAASRKSRWERPRVIARLPVPRPLPQAVAAKHFGQDERGPVNPAADEVREITENHAEIIIDLLAERRQAERSNREADQVRLSAEVQTAVVKYAEDSESMPPSIAGLLSPSGSYQRGILA